MQSHLVLKGSHREHPEGSMPIGQPADQTLEITCVLRRRNEATHAPELKLSHEDLRELHGADPSDVDALESFAAMHDFSIARVDAGARTITLAGQLDSPAKAFGAEMELRQLGEQVIRTR